MERLPSSVPENRTSEPTNASEESWSGSQSERSSTGTSHAERKKKTDVVDTLDHTVLRFNADCCLRTNVSRYLSILPEVVVADESQQKSTAAKTSKAHQVSNKVFLLSGDGQGNGDAADCFQFASLENK